MKRMAIMAALASFGVAAPAWADSMKSVEFKSETKTCEISFTYPQTGETVIDRQIAEWVKKLAADFSVSCKEAEADPTSLGPGGKYTAELTHQVRRDDAKFFSVAFDLYTFTGGAHPNTQQYGQTFLRPDGRRVFIAELIGPGGVRALSAYALKDLKRQWGSEMMSDADWMRRGAGPAAPNFEAFTFKPNGEMEVMFSPYQVAAYAAGPQAVTVPPRVVKTMLRPDPRAPMASFDCTRAATALEKGICADWRIARADRQMAEDYREMLDAAYEPAEKDKLIQSQRDWLKTRDASCGRARDMAGCLLPLIEKRRDAIGAPRN
jgi:peptidoglycan-N-acetylglucosamine deacetylase